MESKKKPQQQEHRSPEPPSCSFFYEDQPPTPEIELPLGYALHWSIKHEAWYVYHIETKTSQWIHEWKQKESSIRTEHWTEQLIQDNHQDDSKTVSLPERRKVAKAKRKLPVHVSSSPKTKYPSLPEVQMKTPPKQTTRSPPKRQKMESGPGSFRFSLPSVTAACTQTFGTLRVPGALRGDAYCSRQLAFPESMDYDLAPTSPGSGFHDEPMEIDSVQEVLDLRSSQVDSWPQLISFANNSSYLDSAKQSLLRVRDLCPWSSLCCVVIDTNVLLDDLQLLRDLKQHNNPSVVSPYLVICCIIPWVVLQELDVLKDRNRSKVTFLSGSQVTRMYRASDRALDYIYREVTSGGESPNLTCQSFQDDSVHVENLNVERNDDRIIKCALLAQNQVAQDQSKGNCVLICTKDRNLIVKTKSGGIEAMTPAQLRDSLMNNDFVLPSGRQGLNRNQELTDSTKTNPHTEEAGEGNVQIAENRVKDQEEFISYWQKLNALEIILRTVLTSEMQRAFGYHWKEILVEKPPLNLIKILKSFEKHWVAVFRFVWNQDVRGLIGDAKKLAETADIFENLNMDKTKRGELLTKLLKLLRPLSGRDDVAPLLNKYHGDSVLKA